MRRIVLLAVASISLVEMLPAQALPSFAWDIEVDASGLDSFAGLGTDAVGNTYIAGTTQSANFPVRNAVQAHSGSPGMLDVFVTKIDPTGNIIYSTYFGGSADDVATAVTVDAKGNVYVTGTTDSTDFPTTSGAYAATTPVRNAPGPISSRVGPTFVFKLNADGSVGYSTYFSNSQSTPTAIAVDANGSAYISGITGGGLAITPGAYQSTCNCGLTNGGIISVPYLDRFLSRFDNAGASLIFSTYLGVAGGGTGALAIAPDGSAYVAGGGIYRFDATGSKLLASSAALGPLAHLTPPVGLALATDGSVYLGGAAQGGFEATAGAFQTAVLPSGAFGVDGIVKLDPQLSHILAATYFNGRYGTTINALALDGSGNLYLGGYTSPRSLPTKAPFFQGFGSFGKNFGLQQTGYLAKLTRDLSTLLFSSELGDNETFGVGGIGVRPDGTVAIGGMTGEGVVSTNPAVPVNYTLNGVAPGPSNIWINSLSIPTLPPLHIDAVLNAASHTSDPVSPGETILVAGTGFGADSQLLINGSPAQIVSNAAGVIAATVPQNITGNTATVQVISGGASSNNVLVAASPASPGLFTADGSGFGQGYILNQDGSLNTTSNPAKPGERITIFATGVGRLTFTDGYAVTQFPPDVFVDQFYCTGVAAVVGQVPGLTGPVYQLTVNLPNLATFKFPALTGIVLELNGSPSQNSVTISIAQ